MATKRTIIKLILDSKGFREGLNNAASSFKSFVSEFDKIRKMSDNLKRVGMQFSSSAKKGKKFYDIQTKSFMGAEQAAVLFSKRMDGVRTRAKKLKEEQKRLTDEANKGKRAFAGWALSLMFGGMMILRTFGNIKKASVSTFMKITEGITEQGKTILRLSAHWEFLKFTIGKAIGDALTPLVPLIVSIVKAMARWISDHPKLTGFVILLMIAIGLFLMTLGQLVLFFFAFPEAIANATVAFKAFKKMFTAGWLQVQLAKISIAIKALAVDTVIAGQTIQIAWWQIILMIAILTAAVVLLKKIWTNTNATLVEKIIATAMVIAAVVLAIAIMFGFWPLALVAAVILMVAVIAMFAKELWTYFKIMLSYVVEFTLKMGQAFADRFDAIAKIVERFVNWFISKWNTIAEKLGLKKIEPVQIDMFEKASKGFDLLIEKNKEWREGLKETSKGFEDPLEKIRRTFGLGGAKMKKGFTMEGTSGAANIFPQQLSNPPGPTSNGGSTTETKTINVAEIKIYTKEDFADTKEAGEQILEQMERYM